MIIIVIISINKKWKSHLSILLPTLDRLLPSGVVGGAGRIENGNFWFNYETQSEDGKRRKFSTMTTRILTHVCAYICMHVMHPSIDGKRKQGPEVQTRGSKYCWDHRMKARSEVHLCS